MECPRCDVKMTTVETPQDGQEWPEWECPSCRGSYSQKFLDECGEIARRLFHGGRFIKGDFLYEIVDDNGQSFTLRKRATEAATELMKEGLRP